MNSKDQPDRLLMKQNGLTVLDEEITVGGMQNCNPIRIYQKMFRSTETET
ncbi:UNVERIFIED_CONTAM: hypothetical protein GTU68_000731 [Idotea baltica]|nr:hypothetical protein [Idotea baltica]